MSDPLFTRATIYFFSGTGNAGNVTQWIAKGFESNGKAVLIQDISKLEKRNNVKIGEGDLVGFISPTHGFNFPPIMFHFLLRLPSARNNKEFIINTRAGMKMGKYFLPGLSGMAQHFSAMILWIKEYRIIGMHPIDLPSNWISFHPGLKKKVVQSIYELRYTETQQLAKKILSNRKDLKAWRDSIQDVLITPIGILYYFFGRFFLAKSFYASGRCNLCYKCERNCPVHAIRIIDERPFWTYRCESCMQCMNKCPERAIETGHGFLTAITILVYFVILTLAYQLTGLQQILQSLVSPMVSSAFTFLIDTTVLLSFLFISYRLVHYPLKFPFFERILRKSSLTTYAFWRRYKPLKYK